MKIGLMVWKVCKKCKCQATDELPDGGSYTVRTHKDGISHVTPHEPGCPRGYKKVQIPDE